MNPKKAEAMRLRLAGKSYNEISKEVGVPKSTLSMWLRPLMLSDSARARLATRSSIGTETLIKRNKMQTRCAEQRAREFQENGRECVGRLSGHDLLVIGAVLYWAEGYKRLTVKNGRERMSHVISFVNADPAMIRTFVRFLRESLDIPAAEIHLAMRLYPHINEQSAREHWTQAAGLPASSFEKTTNMVSLASKGKRPYNRLPFGTLQVTVRNTARFHHLIGLIEGVQKRLEP